MLKLILRRLWLSVTLLFGVSALTFVLESLTPGNPAATILGTQATPKTIASLTKELGFNKPIYVQYWRWLDDALHGNLGKSIFTGEPVSSILSSRLPVTLSLIIGTILVSTIVGISIGVASAKMGGRLGRLVDTISLLGLAIPSYWLGSLLVIAFALRIHALPATGYVTFGQSPVLWLKSLVMPVFALSVFGIAIVAKQTRDAMMDTFDREFIRALRSRGIRSRSIIFKHALRTALPNVVTLLALIVVSLLLGTTLIESVFALPGLGSEAVTATNLHDVPVIEGVAMYFTALTVVVFTLTDLVNAWLNPKIRGAR